MINARKFSEIYTGTIDAGSMQVDAGQIFGRIRICISFYVEDVFL
jgi:hypothetical protein